MGRGEKMERETVRTKEYRNWFSQITLTIYNKEKY